MKNNKIARIFSCVAFLILLAGSVDVLAQQNRYSWRVGVGVGNQFENGDIYNKDSTTSSKALEFAPEYLSYSAFLELSLSQSFGVKAFTNTHPGNLQIINSGLLLSYYTDNDYLLGSKSFIAPYLNLGIAGNTSANSLNIPWGGGLKFRFGSRININLDFTARSYPSYWNDSENSFASLTNAYSSVSVHYNFGRKGEAYNAPRPYVIPDLRTRATRSAGAPAKEEAGELAKGVSPADTFSADTPDQLFVDNPSILDTTSRVLVGTDSAAKARLLRRYGDILNVPKLDDSTEVARSSSVSPKEERQARRFSPRQDSILSDLEFQVKRKKLERELRMLEKAEQDTAVDKLSQENTNLRNQLRGEERYQALQQRIRDLENRGTTTNPNYPSQQAPPTEIRIVREEVPASREGVGGAVVVSSNDQQQIGRLENKIDSLQNALNRLSRSSAGGTANTAVVATSLEPSNDTAAMPIDTMDTDQPLEAVAGITEEEYDALKEELRSVNSKMDSLLKARPEPEPQPVEKPAESVPDNFFKTTGKAEVFFDVSSSELNSSSRDNLDDVVRFAKTNPNSNLLIKAFTDKTGSAAYNKILAEKRGEAVKNYLLGKGIDDSRLKVMGIGPDQSLQGGSQRYGRRVEVLLN